MFDEQEVEFVEVEVDCPGSGEDGVDSCTFYGVITAQVIDEGAHIYYTCPSCNLLVTRDTPT